MITANCRSVRRLCTHVQKDILSQKKQNQRQCYYLYYEVRGDGEVRQQIFCRGTTVRADIYTMLKSLSSYDSELGCKVHAGFRRHADRLLTDVQPLLVSPLDKSSTVEVCGHSLGGKTDND